MQGVCSTLHGMSPLPPPSRVFACVLLSILTSSDVNHSQVTQFPESNFRIYSEDQTCSDLYLIGTQHSAPAQTMHCPLLCADRLLLFGVVWCSGGSRTGDSARR